MVRGIGNIPNVMIKADYGHKDGLEISWTGTRIAWLLEVFPDRSHEFLDHFWIRTHLDCLLRVIDALGALISNNTFSEVLDLYWVPLLLAEKDSQLGREWSWLLYLWTTKFGFIDGLITKSAANSTTSGQ